MLSSIKTANTEADVENVVPCRTDLSSEETSEGSALIVVTKNWLLPARPKPGRRPSKEIPLTKRKAQNREAQRAFRERRAARVLELESCVKQLQDLVNKLKQEYSQKIQLFVLEKEQLIQKNEQFQREIMYLKNRLKNTPNYHSFAVQQTISPEYNEDLSNISFTQGLSIDAKDFPTTVIGQAVPLKRKKMDFQKIENVQFKSLLSSENNLENMESKKSSNDSNYMKHQKISEANDLNQINSNTSFSASFMPRNDSMIEGNDCGFCTGNPDVCLCFQAQNLNNEMRNMAEIDKNILPPILIHNDNIKDVEEKVSKDTKKTEKLEILEPSSYTVRNEYEPGSCAQCKADPLSILFCKSFASKINYNRTFAKCYFNDDNTNDSNSGLTNNNSNSDNNFLPCSIAYKTLSQHQRFVKENFGIIINNLASGNRGMHIQANRIQETLSLLDHH